MYDKPALGKSKKKDCGKVCSIVLLFLSGSGRLFERRDVRFHLHEKSVQLGLCNQKLNVSTIRNLQAKGQNMKNCPKHCPSKQTKQPNKCMQGHSTEERNNNHRFRKTKKKI